MRKNHIISSTVLATVLATEKNNHGADFTIKSKDTGKDYTYKIERSMFNDRWYTHVKVEVGYLDFQRLGTYSNGSITNKKVPVETPAAKAIAWVLAGVEAGKFNVLDSKIEVMHLGSCLVCGRELTDSVSIEAGMGPTCRSRK